MKSPSAGPLAAVGVTLVLWASAFVAIRHLAPIFSPGALSLGRLLVAALALGIGVLASGWTPPTRAEWLRMIAIGVLWFGVYNLALNAGERQVDAGTAAMLIQLSPIMIAVLAVAFLGERASAFLVVGIGLAFAGVVLIAVAGSNGRHGLTGVLLCLLSAASYAVSLVLQKPVVARISPLQLTFVACTTGAVVCLPFAGELVQQGSAHGGDVAWLVYLGLLPTAVAFTTYAYALRHMDASSLGVTTYLVPPITVLLSWLLLGETPPWVAYVGGALALIGVAVARRRPRNRTPAAPGAPSPMPATPGTPRGSASTPPG